MYLRKIDYEILKMMRDLKQSQTKQELENYSNSLDPKSDFKNTFKYLSETGFIILRRDPDIYAITIKGEIAIEEYEIDIRSKLALPEEANKQSQIANSKAGKANVLAVISVTAVIIDIILRLFKIL